MKKISNKQKIIYAILAIIILAGIVITATMGLNFSIEYAESKRIEIAIGKEFESIDIKQIAKETFGNVPMKVEKVELFEDVVAITVKDVTDEQLETLNKKINEKYGLQQESKDLKVTKMPHARGRDLIRPYLVPMAIATAIILVYLMIRFYSLGIGKVLAKTIGITVLAELTLLSLIAITRFPLNSFVIPMGLVVYVGALAILTANFERKLRTKKLEENNDKKK